MLRNCEAGTHSFHRDDEDDYVPSGSSGVRQAQVQGQGQVNDMRRKSFAGGEGMYCRPETSFFEEEDED
jgi:hypothetical protein